MNPEDLVLTTRSDMEMLSHLATSYRMATELMEMANIRFCGIKNKCEFRTNLEPPYRRSDNGTIDTCGHKTNKARECHIICCPLDEESGED